MPNNITSDIDNVFDSDKLMVQINDHEERTVKILDSPFSTLGDALNAISEAINKK